MFLALNPLTRSVAISEILILMALTFLCGYCIGYLIMRRRIKRLKESRELAIASLEKCHDQKRLLTLSSTSASQSVARRDNLKVIEGIGPKIEQLLYRSGIFTFSQLSGAPAIYISKLLFEAGNGFQMHDPRTWPEQARLARDGKWQELEELQNELDGGRQV